MSLRHAKHGAAWLHGNTQTKRIVEDSLVGSGVATATLQTQVLVLGVSLRCGCHNRESLWQGRYMISRLNEWSLDAAPPGFQLQGFQDEALVFLLTGVG